MCRPRAQQAAPHLHHRGALRNRRVALPSSSQTPWAAYAPLLSRPTFLREQARPEPHQPARLVCWMVYALALALHSLRARPPFRRHVTPPPPLRSSPSPRELALLPRHTSLLPLPPLVVRCVVLPQPQTLLARRVLARRPRRLRTPPLSSLASLFVLPCPAIHPAVPRLRRPLFRLLLLLADPHSRVEGSRAAAWRVATACQMEQRTR